MFTRKSQKGFTLPELLFVVVFALALGIAGTVVYVAWHFISKFW